MKYSNRVSEQQQKFIRKVREGTLTMQSLQQTEQGKAKQLARWFRNKFFRFNLKRAMRDSEHRAELEAHLIAIEARAALAEAIRNKKPLEQDALAMYTSALDQDREDRRLARAAARRRKKKVKVDPERDLVHPRFKHQEAELLAVLQEGRG
jgi:hypothetical protein